MKIAIDYGHCLSGYDTGASSNGLKEEILTREIGKLLVSKLKIKGHIVDECNITSSTSLNNSLGKRISTINSANADLSISLHINAGGGTGSEIFTDGSNIELVNKILEEFEKLGYRNRGIKDGKDLAVVGGVKCNAMLIESFFIDNIADIKLYNADKIATAISSAFEDVSKNSTEIAIVNTEEKVVSQYKELGTFYCSVDKIYFRNNVGIKDSNKVIGDYKKGEKVNYDKVVITDKYVYISWISASVKIRRYMPIREITNGKYGDIWGRIK